MHQPHAHPALPPYPHPACLPEAELLKQCDISTGRSGGPGGQHRNKVETLVRIVHTPTGVEAHAGERRSQVENKHVAIRRLRETLALRIRCPVPKGRGIDVLDQAPGSALWRERTRTGAIACNPHHDDYPSLLAEALDMLAEHRWEPRAAAVLLGVSASQLIKLIKDLHGALAHVNAERERLGLHALK